MNTIYIDVLFLINFSVDYMALYLTGKALRFGMRRLRLVIASLLLAFYALWALLLCASYPLLILTAVLAGALGCLIAFRVRSVRTLFRQFLVFTGISCLSSACMMLLYRILSHMLANADMHDNGMKVLVFIVLAVLSGCLIGLGNHLLTDVRGEKAVEVEIQMNGRRGRFHLLVDSGNLVRDPMMGKCVVFLGEREAVAAFGDRIKQADYLASRRCIVSVTGVNGKELILAYRPDTILCKGKPVDALMAVLPKCSVGKYDGIFPAALCIGEI